MKYITQFHVILVITLFSCQSSIPEAKNDDLFREVEIEDSTIEHIQESVSENSIPLDSFELDNELPFKYPCESSFKYIGVIKVSDTRWEEIQIGKGWDSRRHSCTFVWGEHIYNNFPPDTVITDFRMHLVDLDSFDIELTPEFLKSTLFKKNLIVTTINGENDLKTIWDPNKTGKYPKPNHWGE